MIRISVYRNDSGKIKGFKVSGHALFDDPGRDIVCSAVSVLVINTVNSIEKFLPAELFRVDSDEKTGCIECFIKEPVSDEAGILLKAMVFGIENIRDTYGSEFVTIDRS
ncbi:MAG: ribosomal-processing cysteine protease Prp [Lachnospiraceae bacterium]|nr:ribosomal-processing cysteine protease Prp [Lachnospiraceae bacterium]